MEFGVLGPVEVNRGHARLAIGGRQRRLLLAVLLSRHGQACSFDSLSQALWGDEPPPAAAEGLHAQVSRLRKVLEPDRAARAPARVLVFDDAGYRIELDGHSLDAVRFAELSEQGSGVLTAGDPVSAKAQLGEAVRLWRGRAYGDLADHPALAASCTALEERRLAATEDLIQARMQLGEHAELVGDIEGVLVANPYRERVWGQLMLAFYRCGRQAEALAAYQRYRRALADELGIEPSPELRALEEAVLLQKNELDWHPSDETAPAHLPVRHERMTFLGGFGGRPDTRSRLIRRAIGRTGGTATRPPGDGETAIGYYGSPLDALRGAAELGRLGAEDGSALAICVHTGPAVRIDEEWFGPAISHLSRLGSLAGPGQILVSEATAERVRGRLPAPASLRSLGMFRFLDQTKIERIHQLDRPGSRKEFPPLRASAELIGLPAETSSFIGREREVARIVEQVHDVRMLTLSGPGGMGKTRLAMRAARRALDVCPDGVLFADLAPVDSGGRLPTVLARSLRLPDDRGEAALAAVTEFLRDRRMLVVLDNCEHLLDAAAELASTLLRGSPNVRVLATSREPLAVPGESAWPVPALTLPTADTPEKLRESEAGRLFCERARSVVPSFELDGANVGDISSICRRLDGLPLAIELAAARLRILSPGQISARLDDRFTLLVGSGRSVLPRQQTLRAVVDWSYDQLDGAAQRLLAQLSVFPGSFSLEAAEAVGGTRCLDLLTELIDKSLVQARSGAETRYRLLETLRAYAGERLAEDPTARRAAQVAHAEFFARIAGRAATELRGSNDVEWSRRLDVDYENVREAMEWAGSHDPELLLGMVGSLGDYWFGHGPYRDAESFTSAALAATSDATPGRSLALCAAAWQGLVRGDFVAMADSARQALALATERGERRPRGDARFQLAYASDACEDYDEALVHADALARDEDVEPWHHTEAFSHLVRIHLELDRHEHARQFLPEALAAARLTGDRFSSILTLREAGRVAALDDDHDAALSYHREALRLAAEAGHGRQVVWCLRFLRRAMLGVGDVAAAREYATNAAAIAADLGGPQQVAATQLYLAELDRLVGDVGSALSRLATMRASPAYANPAGLLRGEIELLAGNPAAARSAFLAATQTGHNAGRACAAVGAIAAAFDLGEAIDAKALQSARERLLPPARHDVRAWYLSVAARTWLNLGSESEWSVSALAEAVTQAERATDLPSVVRASEQAVYLFGAADPGAASRLLAVAATARDRMGMPRAPLETAWHNQAVTDLAVRGPVTISAGITSGSRDAARVLVRCARALLDAQRSAGTRR